MMSINTFQVRPGTVDRGRDYEKLFISNIVLELVLDENIKNFTISSNDNNFGAFDDVVIEIEYINGEKKHYAIQLKHGERLLRLDSLKGKTGNFSLKKYFETVSNLTQNRNVNNFKWILFTNRKCDNANGATFRLENEDFDVKMSSCFQEELFENCFGNAGYAYEFESDNTAYRDFFDNFILCTNQLNSYQMETRLLQQFQEKFDCDKNVFLDYVKFIANWSKVEHKKEKLNKAWMKEVIALCLLSPFVQAFRSNNDVDVNKTNIFQKIINTFDITLFEKSLSDYVKNLWNVNDKLQEIKSNEVKKIKTKYQIEDKGQDKESSVVLWLLNKCPLIIKYEESIINAIKLCSKKKFIILHNNILPEVSQNVFEDFALFQNLTDLNEKNPLYEELVKTFECSLQEKPKITLEKLIGEIKDIKEFITTNQLLLSLNNSLVIGGEKENVPNTYIERSFSTNIIDYNFLNKATEDTIIVIAPLNETVDEIRDFKKIDLETVLNQKTKMFEKDMKTIYVSKNDIYRKKFDLFCKKLGTGYKYHQFKIFKRKLEWVRSQTGLEDLREHQLLEYFVEEEVLHRVDDNTLLICGDPGLGKSVSMQNFKNNTFSTFWSVLIYPRDHSKHFREKKDNVYEFEKYLLKKARKKYQDFELKIFKTLLKNGRVNYIWDGIDEVSETNLPPVINIIETFQQKGLNQCITSRNNLKKELENKFCVLSRTIKQFDEGEQKRYIRKRLNYEENELRDVYTKIKNNIQFFKFNEILGIPLQINMFTELFLHDQKTYNYLLNNVFSLTDLYSHFIDIKFTTYFKKANIDDSNDMAYERNKKYKENKILLYELAALKMHFPVENSKIYENLEEFLTEIRNRKDPVGIITAVSSDNIPTFLHNSYGEYFAASHLARDHKQTPLLFEERYRNIRFLFDLILAKNCPAHNAVLCKNYQMLKTCNKVLLTSKDRGERSPLHLACSWGEPYPTLEVADMQISTIGARLWHKFKMYKYMVDDKMKGFTRKPNRQQELILKYLNQHCDPKEVDQVYNMNAFSYADRTFGVLSLIILSQKHEIPFNSLKNFNNTPSILYYASKLDYSNIFDIFTEIPLVCTKEGDSLLNVATTHGSLSVCQKLLSKNAIFVNYSNKYGNTPLYIASWLNHAEIAKLLLEHGADVNATKKNGYTPLYIACEQGHYEIVKLFIENDANVNTVVMNKYTPLYITCKKGFIDIAKLLITNGAIINVAMKNVHTPDLTELLMEHNSQTKVYEYIPLYIASKKGHSELVKLLIDNGADVNVVDQHGDNPLIIASEKEHFEIVKLLVENGACVNAAKKNGYTPLFIASELGFVEIVKFLVKFRAEVNVSNEQGETPLYVARKEGHAEIVKLLTEHGASEKLHENKCLIS